MDWHPFAEKFPLMEGEEWEAFKQSIQETGGNQDPVEYRMRKGKKEGIDGRNRHQACVELGLKCTMKLISLKDDEVKAYIIRRNIHRRHLTKELRIVLVAELREDGHSTRSIAETIGVSHTTVQNDIKESGGKNLPSDSQNTTNSQKITGQDGKTYDATKPVLCNRCKRTGAVKDCKACEEARKNKPKGGKGGGSGGKKAEQNGAPEPETPEGKMKAINSGIESFCREVMKLVEEKMPDDFWLRYDNTKEGARRKFKDGCDLLRSKKCSALCPKCEGTVKDGKKECAYCHSTGRLPKMQLEMV